MIEVGRCNIIVRNVDTNSKEYKSALMRYSLYDKVTHKYTFHAFYQYENDLYFPSSITVDEIKKLFPSKQIVVDYSKTAKAKSIDYVMKHTPRDSLQEQAISFLMKVRKDPETHQRFLSLETGKGKTYVTINAISKLKKRAMIIVDTLDLADQWKREFLNHTNLEEKDIVVLSGQESVDKQMVLPTGKIYIAIHRTLSNMISNDMLSIGKLMNKLGIGIRVFDESHVEYMNICRINSLSNVEYTIYLTATPSRSAYQDDSLYAKVFRHVPYFNGKELGSERYCKIIMCKMNTHPGLDDRIAARTKYGFNQAKWASYVANDGYQFLLEAIVKIFDNFKLVTRDKKVAIMLPTIELIKKIKDDLTIQYPGIDIGTFIGEISKNKRLDELGKKFILTNDKIFDKGIDVKDLEILILLVPISSAVKTEQIVGRLRDRKDYSSIVIDVTDIGFDECVRQSKLRKRFYKKRAKEIIEIKNIL
jgi:superfamily II DNA or RNA helicase